jgi:hypothetical protein
VEKRADIRGPEVYTYDIGVLGSQAFATSLSCCSMSLIMIVWHPFYEPFLYTCTLERWVGLGSRLVDISDRDTCSHVFFGCRAPVGNRDWREGSTHKAEYPIDAVYDPRASARGKNMNWCQAESRSVSRSKMTGVRPRAGWAGAG